jgi:hypothetical protein
LTSPDMLAAARRIARQLALRQPATVAALPSMLVQALKVGEEAGELAQAVLGHLGENPRKGVTHTTEDVLHEAIDVALSALVLGMKVAPDTFASTVAERLAYLEARAAASGAPQVAA